MDSFKQKFVEEAREFLTELEDALLKLESVPDDQEVIEQIFRIMHTLKGNSAMFGFHKIDEFTHELETIYDLVRNGKLPVGKAILDLTLKSIDHVGNLLDEDEDNEGAFDDTQARLLGEIKGVIRQDGDGGSRDDGKGKGNRETEPDGKARTYYVYFQPAPDILKNGTNPLYLVDDFNGIGEFVAYPQSGTLPSLDEVVAEHCYLGWEIVLTTSQEVDSIHEVFLFVEDDCQLDIQKVSDQDLLAVDGFRAVLDSIFLEKGGEHLQALRDRVEELELEQEKNSKEDKRKVPIHKTRGTAKSTISSIRVASEKLDELMNLVSELVTNQASLNLLAEQSNLPEIITVAESMEKITRQLRENTFSIALIPIETIITRFHRLVRDLSSELGKQVDFITEGTETELDKNIIESLADPIMHILRNSLDHGIEARDERMKKGKSERGRILFKAFYSGMNVFIQIQDDGAGIDPEKIRMKAISKGLISAETDLSQKECFDLLFVPGFSTAQKVTEVSGRGVGMDVVRRKIEDLRGSVDIDSVLGEGSTITIKLPLTLSIIDGLLVTIDNTYFVIPLQVVDKVFEVPTKQVVNKKQKLIALNGELQPFLYLRDEFDMTTEAPATTRVILVKYENYQVGLCVDDIVGEYQAVLKPLGKLFKKQEIVSGATILGDGTVALVVDSNKIIDRIAIQQAELNAVAE
ncbi:MAG: chemotaxis protein CheA [Bacteroidales bacterium]